MKRPKWATMKIRFYFSVCWAATDANGGLIIEGVNWLHDQLLFFCAWFHNYFVQPFFETAGFPIKIIKTYESDGEYRCRTRSDS